jgi:hypothetical protein
MFSSGLCEMNKGLNANEESHLRRRLPIKRLEPPDGSGGKV